MLNECIFKKDLVKIFLELKNRSWKYFSLIRKVGILSKSAYNQTRLAYTNFYKKYAA